MYCIIDIGSNTIRLVIYRIEGSHIQPILNNKHTAGLAGYIDKKNYLTQEGITKLISVLQEFKEVLRILPDCPVYPFATASLRNIINTDQVLDAVKKETGFEIEVISGYEEAMLDYRGAIRSIPKDTGLLVDIGGGSTELVFFKEKKALAAHSIPIGSLNLYSRFIEGVLPKKKEIRIMNQEIQRILADAMPPAQKYAAQQMCGVGGTARATFALYKNLYKTKKTATQYPVDFLEEVLKQTEENPRKLMRRILKIAPERVHTLIPGILILHNIAAFYGSNTIYTSPYGVRDGYLASILEKEAAHNVQ